MDRHSAAILRLLKQQLVCVALLFATPIGSTAMANSFDVWFGTTTPQDGPSRGIYYSQFDTETGRLSPPILAARTNSPGFLALHPNGEILYATGGPQGGPVVSAFRIDRSGEKPTLNHLNSQPTGDGTAAHLSVDRTGTVLLSAQYGGGSTSVYPIMEDGSIGPVSDVQKHEGGSGVSPSRQDRPHAHWVGTSPDNRFAFVPDLGMDRVIIYKLKTGPKPSLKPHGEGVCPPGSGPRHMKFCEDGRHIYVLNELTLTVSVFDYDPTAGTMERKQTIATLSEEVKAKEAFNSASEIRVHPSGDYVYTANRGNDTITVFRIDRSDGTLQAVEVEPIRGGWPRNFNVDPTGRFLIAAGRDSHTATVFSIAPETGELTYRRELAHVPTPICVEFGRGD